MKLIRELELITESVLDLKDRVANVPEFFKEVQLLVRKLNNNKIDDLTVENFFKEINHVSLMLDAMIRVISPLTNDDTVVARRALKNFTKEYTKFLKSADYKEMFRLFKHIKDIGDRKEAKSITTRLKIVNGLISRSQDILEQ